MVRTSSLSDVSFSPDGIIRIARLDLDGSHAVIQIVAFAFSWLKDAKNMLRAFANRRFKNDPLPFVRRMFPGFYDGEHYQFVNEEEGILERKTEQEITDWYNARMTEYTNN